MGELPRRLMTMVETDELVSLTRIKNYAQAYLLSSDHQHEDQRRELQAMLAEHRSRFDTPEAKRYRQLAYPVWAEAAEG